MTNDELFRLIEQVYFMVRDSRIQSEIEERRLDLNHLLKEAIRRAKEPCQGELTIADVIRIQKNLFEMGKGNE